MKQCIVYALTNAYLLLLPQLEKSIILSNLWNVTPVQRNVYVCMYLFFRKCKTFGDSVRSVLNKYN